MKKILLILLFFVAACSDKEEFSSQVVENTADTNIVTESQDVEEAIISYDIKPNSVIFFMPSAKEQKKLINFYGQSVQYEFKNIFVNFKSLYKSARKALQNAGFNTELTNAKEFKIILDTTTVVLNVADEGQIVGFIMNDGKKYKACYGVYTNKKFIKEIRDFFGIKFNFAYKPENTQVVVRQDTADDLAP